MIDANVCERSDLRGGKKDLHDAPTSDIFKTNLGGLLALGKRHDAQGQSSRHS
jgi:hypothetical protein